MSRQVANMSSEIKRVRRRQLAKRDGWVCWLCGGPLSGTPEQPGPDVTLDHLHTLINGGDHALENLRLAHKRFNHARGDGEVTQITTAPSKRATHKRPKHTCCSNCGRRWFSDLSPKHRCCPQCGAFDSYVIGTADTGRQWIRELAA